MVEKSLVYILMGSNISPEENIRSACNHLKNLVDIQAISPVWETPPVGSPGPNFLNLVIAIQTHLKADELKFQILRPLEAQLGRLRTNDKYAPRTMDLDILIFGSAIMEPQLWQMAHIACPLAGLLPELRHPESDLSLRQAAAELAQQGSIRLRPDIRLEIGNHSH